MKNLLFLLSAVPLLAAETMPSGAGLAAKYPGDAGIERDPRVVQVEKFEQADIAALATQWESVGAKDSMSFAAEVPPGSAGKQSLLMDRQKGPGGSFYRRLKNAAGGFGYDRIFARYYVKFAEDCAELHHFGPCLGGNLPATPWPSVKAGIRTDGAKSFWSGIEPFGKAWTWDFYTYWGEMRGSPPRGQTWGNSFIRDPKLAVAKGRWICVEQMIRMNDVGDTNGEQALWLDGKLVAHLGKGFPRGRWIFDKFEPGQSGRGIRWNDARGEREDFEVPEGGAPFEGYRWRTVSELNVNYVWLYVYTEKPEGHRIRVWYDDVVVATDYIGPISTAGSKPDQAAQTHEGVWKPIAAVLGGARLPAEALNAITLKITGDKYEVAVEGEKEPDKGTCTLDLTTTPKRMTIKSTEGPNRGKTFLAIYEMKDAGSLRVCYDLSGTDFPKEFKAPKGTPLYLVGYRRPKE